MWRRNETLHGMSMLQYTEVLARSVIPTDSWYSKVFSIKAKMWSQYLGYVSNALSSLGFKRKNIAR